MTLNRVSDVLDLIIQSIGTVLLSFKLTIGRVAVAGVPLYTNEAIAGLKPTGLSSEYLYYGLQYWDLLKDVDQAIKGATLNKEKLKRIAFKYPENELEQSKIAEVLSTVDRAIEQTEQLIAKQQRIKTGLMQDLLTRGIDEHGNIRSEETHEFKDSPLGRIPVEWEVVAVEQLGDIVTGTTPSTAEASFYGGDVMFISPKDVSNETDRILGTEKKLSNKGLCVCRAIPKNSICTVCIGSTIGKMGISTVKCATNQQINTLVPHEEKDAEMLYFSMTLFLPTQLRREAGLQAVPIVNKAVLKDATSCP